MIPRHDCGVAKAVIHGRRRCGTTALHMIRSSVLFGLALAMAACAGTGPAAEDARWLQPAQAIQLAADAAPRGVTGTFVLQVRGTGSDDGRVYLNSETDYRDQRNLTIAITPAAAGALTARLGAPPAAALAGQRIVVDGVATRVRIDFTVDGHPSGKYYYQTQVQVTDAAQIRVPAAGLRI